MACAAFEAFPERIRIPVHDFESVDECEYNVQSTWRQLPLHLKKNEQVAFHALKARGGPSWKTLPFQLHDNLDLLITALFYGKIAFEDVPKTLKQNNPKVALFCIQHEHIQADIVLA
ncbi:hypothetical protein ACA910_012066 [Epithemia clementina (nom. ined.)]